MAIALDRESASMFAQIKFRGEMTELVDYSKADWLTRTGTL